MKTALDRIIDYKHDEVAALKRETSEGAFLSQAATAPAPRGFARALDQVVDRCSTRQDHSSSQHGTAPQNAALVNSAVATY